MKTKSKMTTVRDQRYSYYEFFAGAGLAREGLGDSWRCLWANDFDERKQSVYVANHGADDFVLADICDVSAESLPPGADLAWASFPCQDLSLAGWRRGMRAERSGTFWAFWRVLRDLDDSRARPSLLVLENVPGLLYGDDFTGLCEALAALDLQYGALVVDARHFVPQSRPRVFVVAVDSRVDVRPLTEAIQPNSPWVSKKLAQAAGTLPKDLLDRWRWWSLPSPSDSIAPLSALVEEEPPLAPWFSEEQVQRLLALMSEPNRRKIDKAIRARAQQVGFAYRRTRRTGQQVEVRFDGLSGCLRTPRGGSSRQIVLVTSEGRLRARLLSPREAARLMGLRDSFVLPANYNEAYLAMGDAVVVPVVSWIEQHLLRPLAQLALAAGTKPWRRDTLVRRHRESAQLLAESWERASAGDSGGQ